LSLHQYAYEACDFEGKIQSGQISGQMGAENEQEVVAALQNRQLVPIKSAVSLKGNRFQNRMSLILQMVYAHWSKPVCRWIVLWLYWKA